MISSLELLSWICIIEAVLLILSVALICGHALGLWREQRWSWPQLIRGRAMLAATLDGPVPPPADLKWLGSLPVQLQIRLFTSILVRPTGLGRERITRVAQIIGLLSRVETLCGSPLWWRRLQGGRLFTLFGGGWEYMHTLLRDPHPLVRAQAAEWAVEHPHPGIINSLLGLLDDGHALCRVKAQDSLLRMGSVVKEPLHRYLISHPDSGVEAGLRVAVGVADQRFLPVALHLCRDASPRVRILATELMGAVGGREAVDMLTRLLNGADPEVRAAAARALGKLGHWPAATTLVALLQDRRFEVRWEAGLALQALGAPGMLWLRRALVLTGEGGKEWGSPSRAGVGVETQS
jgi:HEAT repeat protein